MAVPLVLAFFGCGGRGVEGSRVYRFWGDHRKVEYIKAPAGSDYFCFCDLQGKCCEGNQ